MIPQIDELLPFVNNRKAAAIKFDVTEKTIVRWLQRYDLYKPRLNFGCDKLNMEKAEEIREKFRIGASMKDLASEYHVTFSAISRIIHNITYKIKKETAKVVVVYNPH